MTRPSDTPSRAAGGAPHILFVSHSSASWGAERSMAELAAGLAVRSGCRVTVALPRPGPLQDLLEPHGVAVRFGNGGRWTSQRASLGRRALGVPRLLRGALQLRSLIGELRPDLVVSNTVSLGAPALAAWSLGIPHLWYLREFPDGHRFDLGLAPSLRLGSALSSAVVVNCEALRERLRGCVPEGKIHLIYNAVELAISDEAVQSLRASRPPGASLRAVQVSRISEAKGQHDAIRAVALLRERGVAAELSLVGDGDEAYLRKLADLVQRLDVADRVRFEGFDPEPWARLCAADVALVCSRQEAGARVAVEALRLGLPVVSTRVGGLPEHVRPGENGFLYEPDQPAALADHLEALARDPGLRERMARNASLSAERYSLARQLAEFLQLGVARGGARGTRADPR